MKKEKKTEPSKEKKPKFKSVKEYFRSLTFKDIEEKMKTIKDYFG